MKKARRRLPIEVLGKTEVASLLDACQGHGVTDIRNRALIAVLYRSGACMGQVCRPRRRRADQVLAA